MGKEIFELKNGEKFAFLLISSGHIDSNLPDIYELKSDLWAMKKFPLELDKNWRDWLGEFRIEDIQDASLCISSKCRSVSIDSLDLENEKLKKQVRSFLSGIELSGFCQFSNDHFILTGSMIENNANVRSVNIDDHSFYQIGAPFENITVERLNNSLKISEALDKLESLRSEGNYKRIFRSLYAYHSALQEMDLGEKLHQFVRSMEGFIFSKQGEGKKQFISKTELFLGKGHHDFSSELYNLRCKIEHLYGPYSLEVGEPNRKYRLHINQLGLESETLARYCWSNFLLKERIWPHFENDEKIDLFWQLDEKTKRDIWGTPFDLKQVAATFRLDVVDDSSLLLKETKS
jgi:hypothetical protein